MAKDFNSEQMCRDHVMEEINESLKLLVKIETIKLLSDSEISGRIKNYAKYSEENIVPDKNYKDTIDAGLCMLVHNLLVYLDQRGGIFRKTTD